MTSPDLSLVASLKELTTSEKPSDFLRAARMVNQAETKLRPLRIGFLSTFTLNLLETYLKVNAALAGYFVESYFGPFQQLEQEAFTANSALYQANPDIIVVAALLEDISPLNIRDPKSFTREEITNASEAIRNRFSALRKVIEDHSTAHVVFLNFTATGSIHMGPIIRQQDCGPDDLRYQCNRKLQEIASRFPGTSVFNLAGLAAQIGVEKWFDLRMYYYARQPMTSRALCRLGASLTRHFTAILQPRKKCLILDLDNTLWGGVIGEEGPGGIHFGDEYPGNAFKDFHRYLRCLRDDGVLLAIASKNNPSDVEEVFSTRTDFPLRLDDFAAIEIHWKDKSESIRAIAQTLSIGTDSLVFFDDNPAERAEIRMNFPEVVVIEVPAAPELYIDALHKEGLFEQLSVSQEDLHRADFYRIEKERRELRKETPSKEAFLTSLEMAAEIAPITPATLGRCEQLLTKTNQFNLTTRRHSGPMVKQMIAHGGIALYLTVNDRFGDLGIVGIGIAMPLEVAGEWEIDSFLLSCRALGRNAETLLLRALLNEILAKGGKRVLGHYRRTPKNAQTAQFYSDHGFAKTPREGQFNIALDAPLPLPECFKVKIATS